jgi:hypothetical protein
MDGIAEARAIGCYKGAVQDGVADHLAVSRRTCEQEKPKVGMFGPTSCPAQTTVRQCFPHLIILIPRK